MKKAHNESFFLVLHILRLGSFSSQNGTPGSQTKTKQRVVAGGTVVEDIKDGHGPEAKPGKMVIPSFFF